MPHPQKKSLCSICKKPVANKDNPYFPFCSERCKLIDLGKWFDGDYSIEGPDQPIHEEDAEQETI